jgi:hypothetical protein
MSALDNIEKLVSQYGLTKTHDREHKRLSWVVTCGCNATEAFQFPPTAHPDMMYKGVRQHGWRIEKKRAPVCVECIKSEKAPKEQFVMSAPTPTISTVDPNKKIMRRVYALLDDHFDEQTKRYAKGWNDERVAKEADTSLALVIATRKEAYGDLAEDPEVTIMLDELAEFEAATAARIEQIKADYVAQLAPLRDTYTAALKQYEEFVAETEEVMRGQATELRTRVLDLARFDQKFTDVLGKLKLEHKAQVTAFEARLRGAKKAG